jgi:hypothetical protein
MTEKHPAWTRRGSAFCRAHHERWKRSDTAAPRWLVE